MDNLVSPSSLPTPLNSSVLIQLDPSAHKTIAVTEKKYDSRTTGIVIAVADDIQDELTLTGIEHKRVWFAEYKDDVRFVIDDVTYAFIKYEDIRGYDDQTR